jgi:LEA14-like dessication related protein
MKNLKRIFIICIVSLYISSCTDIITDNDLEMIDNIENTEVTTETAAFIDDDEVYEDNSGKGN